MGYSSKNVKRKGRKSTYLAGERRPACRVGTHPSWSCYSKNVMSIPNVKRYRITSPDGSMNAVLMAVLPKEVDVSEYLSDAAKRFDWKAYQEAQQKQFKVRVGQQTQK